MNKENKIPEPLMFIESPSYLKNGNLPKDYFDSSHHINNAAAKYLNNDNYLVQKIANMIIMNQNSKTLQISVNTNNEQLIGKPIFLNTNYLILKTDIEDKRIKITDIQDVEIQKM